MRYTLCILLLLASLTAKPCGWSGPYGPSFYNLFRQTNIAPQEFWPFLREDATTFYYPENFDNDQHPVGNLKLWAKTLSWPLSEVEKVMYASDSGYDRYWEAHNRPIDVRARVYMSFARKCADVFSYRGLDSWDYDEIAKKQSPDYEALLTEANRLMAGEADPILKRRYAYQIVRIFHYAKRYEEAVAFYENKVKPMGLRYEIDYYTLDQVAGCRFSLKEYERAAYDFLRVFGASQDRKKSAYMSYRFCGYKSGTGKSLLKSHSDSLAYLTLLGVQHHVKQTSALEQLAKLAPTSPNTELLFARELFDLEDSTWPKYLGFSDAEGRSLPNLGQSGKEWAKNLEEIAVGIMENPKTKQRKDYWRLASSYLAFLRGDLALAQKRLPLKGEYAEQAKLLAKVYEVTSWKAVGPEQEARLAELLTGELQNFKDWQLLFNDFVANKYYTQGDWAKAFLMHNAVGNLRGLNAMELVDKLIVFAKKENKNAFEKYLANRCLDKDSGEKDLLAELQYAKARCYMKASQPQKALEMFRLSGITGASVGPRLFSNNTKECFDCDEDFVMEDLVYKASPFAFLKENMYLPDVAESLLKLDSLTRNEQKWKRKLAHYLLGNYYFNISNTGYYRGTLNDSGNCCHYTFVPGKHGEETAMEILNAGKSFSMDGIDWNTQYYYDFQKEARKQYRKTIELSTDKELNARCLYMIAKCELNDYYNNVFDRYSFYRGTVNEESLPYKTAFKELKSNYADTEFYKKILDECSFFDKYVNSPI
ncbi:hypothetical protein FUAX_04780 [Fulvitalea axinellae]|uniref:Tetratricopeptide repeat protein n=1 Tax=Fulvitalea axinellae TaxID=1182444 RepID=A0AAU9C7I0_9BACT|nr:hypothetical protein FUAX_04780 [Fulvitalea axinellae]